MVDGAFYARKCYAQKRYYWVRDQEKIKSNELVVTTVVIDVFGIYDIKVLLFPAPVSLSMLMRCVVMTRMLPLIKKRVLMGLMTPVLPWLMTPGLKTWILPGLIAQILLWLMILLRLLRKCIPLYLRLM